MYKYNLLSQKKIFLLLICCSLFMLYPFNESKCAENEIEKNIKRLKSWFWSDTRKEAAIALGKVKDKRAVEPLIEALKDRNRDVRRESTFALGEIKDTKAVAPLIFVLEDKDWWVRSTTALALGKIKDNRAVEPLINALDDDEWYVRNSAAEALLQMKDNRAAQAISRFLSQTIRALSHNADPEIRRKAALILGTLKDTNAVEPLTKALNDKSHNVRVNAIRSLAKIGATDSLIVALKNDNDTVRKEANELLGSMNQVEAIDPLIVGLKDEDFGVREAAANSLGKTKSEKAVKPLMEALRLNVKDNGYASPTWITNLPSAFALLGEPAVEPLITALKNDKSHVREGAAEALGLLGDKRGIKPLEKNLVDWLSNEKVAVSLLKLGWKPQSNMDQIHLLVAQRNKDQLKNKWVITRNILLKDVESNSYRRIENALYAFIGIGRKEIIPVLVEMLNQKGNKTMAEAYLNCGHWVLDKTARDWAARHGYTIKSGRGAAPVGWGAM